MNDLVIKVSKRSRLIDLDHSTLGIVGENLQEKLIFTFQDEFVDGMARLEYELNNEKHYVLMEKVGQSYILPVQNVLLTKEGNIDLQLVVTQDKTGTPVFKSEVFTLYCKKSIEAVGEAPSSYELWIEKANRILLEASRVNIDGKKTGNETVITITQRDGNKKSFPILDGKDGAVGPQGPQGPVGPQGPEGPQGPVGPTPDLSDYVKNTDYATSAKGGVITTNGQFATGMSGSSPYAVTRNFETYQTMANGAFIGKGTLENVITGKQLVNQTTLNESQAEQDERTLELQAELERYKLLENALPHTENETESDYVTLENTAKSPMEIETIPQTSQDGEPTPDNPQEINRTTGENQVKVVGKNLFDVTDFVTKCSPTFTASYQNGVLNIKRGTSTTYEYPLNLEENKQYTLKMKFLNNNSDYYVRFKYSDGTNSAIVATTAYSSYTEITATSSENKTLVGINIQLYGWNNDVFIQQLQLESGTTAATYSPYEETTYPISLGTKEMYNINGVYDGFVYDESVDKFYIERKNGKVVLNGSENWAYNVAYTFFHVPNSSTPNISSNEVFTNYYKYFPNISGIVGAYGCSVYQNAFRIKNTDYTNVNDFKNWLSTHNTIVVYQLVNATLEEITDTTLISQLRAIKNALSMQGTTHIISTASGSNLPFLIKARAVQTIERT